MSGFAIWLLPSYLSCDSLNWLTNYNIVICLSLEKFGDDCGFLIYFRESYQTINLYFLLTGRFYQDLKIRWNRKTPLLNFLKKINFTRNQFRYIMDYHSHIHRWYFNIDPLVTNKYRINRLMGYLIKIKEANTLSIMANNFTYFNTCMFKSNIQ